VALLVDLGRQPAEDPLGLGLVRRGLAQVQFAPGERVDTRVDDHLEGVPALAGSSRAAVAWQPPEPSTQTTGCHNGCH